MVRIVVNFVDTGVSSHHPLVGVQPEQFIKHDSHDHLLHNLNIMCDPDEINCGSGMFCVSHIYRKSFSLCGNKLTFANHNERSSSAMRPWNPTMVSPAASRSSDCWPKDSFEKYGAWDLHKLMMLTANSYCLAADARFLEQSVSTDTIAI